MKALCSLNSMSSKQEQNALLCPVQVQDGSDYKILFETHFLKVIFSLYGGLGRIIDKFYYIRFPLIGHSMLCCLVNQYIKSG